MKMNNRLSSRRSLVVLLLWYPVPGSVTTDDRDRQEASGEDRRRRKQVEEYSEEAGGRPNGSHHDASRVAASADGTASLVDSLVPVNALDDVHRLRAAVSTLAVRLRQQEAMTAEAQSQVLELRRDLARECEAHDGTRRQWKETREHVGFLTHMREEGATSASLEALRGEALSAAQARLLTLERRLREARSDQEAAVRSRSDDAAAFNAERTALQAEIARLNDELAREAILAGPRLREAEKRAAEADSAKEEAQKRRSEAEDAHESSATEAGQWRERFTAADAERVRVWERLRLAEEAVETLHEQRQNAEDDAAHWRRVAQEAQEAQAALVRPKSAAASWQAWQTTPGGRGRRRSAATNSQPVLVPEEQPYAVRSLRSALEQAREQARRAEAERDQWKEAATAATTSRVENSMSTADKQPEQPTKAARGCQTEATRQASQEVQTQSTLLTLRAKEVQTERTVRSQEVQTSPERDPRPQEMSLSETEEDLRRKVWGLQEALQVARANTARAERRAGVLETRLHLEHVRRDLAADDDVGDTSDGGGAQGDPDPLEDRESAVSSSASKVLRPRFAEVMDRLDRMRGHLHHWPEDSNRLHGRGAAALGDKERHLAMFLTAHARALRRAEEVAQLMSTSERGVARGKVTKSPQSTPRRIVGRLGAQRRSPAKQEPGTEPALATRRRGGGEVTSTRRHQTPSPPRTKPEEYRSLPHARSSDNYAPPSPHALPSPPRVRRYATLSLDGHSEGETWRKESKDDGNGHSLLDTTMTTHATKSDSLQQGETTPSRRVHLFGPLPLPGGEGHGGLLGE